jgi:hypothetical protein
MNINEIYQSNSKFLKAADLTGPDGRTVKPVLEIDSATVQENTYNGETNKQIVLSFVGKDKVLGLNVTNARRLGQLLGPDSDQWPGHRIKLFVDQTELDGKTVDCIRIFPDLPEQPESKRAQYTGTQVDTSDIPF